MKLTSSFSGCICRFVSMINFLKEIDSFGGLKWVTLPSYLHSHTKQYNAVRWKLIALLLDLTIQICTFSISYNLSPANLRKCTGGGAIDICNTHALRSSKCRGSKGMAVERACVLLWCLRHIGRWGQISGLVLIRLNELSLYWCQLLASLSQWTILYLNDPVFTAVLQSMSYI